MDSQELEKSRPILPRKPKRRPAGIQWLMLGLLSAALLLTAALVREAYRANRAREQAVDLAMRDLAGVAAWQFGRRLEDHIVTTDVIAFLHAAPAIRQPGASDALSVAAFADAVRPQAAACRCLAGVIAFIRVDMSSGRFHTEPASAATDPLVRWARDSLLALSQSENRRSTEVFQRVPSRGTQSGPVLITGNTRNGVLVAEPGEPVAMRYLLVRNRGGAPLIAYGFIVPARNLLAPLFDDIISQERLLPDRLTGAYATNEVLAVRVSTAGGTALDSSASRIPPTYVSSTTLDRPVGGFRIDAAIAPMLAERLVVPDGPRQASMPVLLLLFVTVATLVAAAAVQLQRQQNLVRLRSDFVAGVSHELRTPLAQIRLLAELLLMPKPMLEENRRRSLTIIDQEARRLANLVENILAFSRAERRRQPLPTEPVLLISEIAEAVEAFQPLADSASSTVVCDIPDGLLVMLNRASFRQVIINLLDNAVRYGPEGQTVRVGAEQRGNEVRVWVDDRGPGIPAAERRRVFEPYYRMARDEGGASGGSGLGLSVVQDIVLRHGGKVWIDDSEGGGTRVMLTLRAPEGGDGR